MELAQLRQAAAEIESALRLQTYPVALKMLRGEGEVPGGAKRPMRDLGHHLSTCQSFALSRRQGLCVAQLMEDMWCVEPVIGFGMGEAPNYFLEGNNRYPGSARTQEAGRRWAQGFPRLRVGEYCGTVSSPAKTADFEPQMVIVYCDPAQLTQLLIVKNWIDGVDVETKLSGHAACVYAVVPTIQTGRWQITVPCRGDRTRALARDDEMIVTIPAAELPDVAEGLRDLQEQGQGMPMSLTMRPDYNLPPTYVTIGKMMGMDWVK